jgi:hypothetical protein
MVVVRTAFRLRGADVAANAYPQGLGRRVVRGGVTNCSNGPVMWPSSGTDERSWSDPPAGTFASGFSVETRSQEADAPSP